VLCTVRYHSNSSELNPRGDYVYIRNQQCLADGGEYYQNQYLVVTMYSLNNFLVLTMYIVQSEPLPDLDYVRCTV
jgi:hypothetical protein